MTDPHFSDKIDADTVETLAVSVGISIPAERREAVAARLRELHRLGAPLDNLDLDGVAPDFDYDPSWPESK